MSVLRFAPFPLPVFVFLSTLICDVRAILRCLCRSHCARLCVDVWRCVCVNSLSLRGRVCGCAACENVKPVISCSFSFSVCLLASLCFVSRDPVALPSQPMCCPSHHDRKRHCPWVLVYICQHLFWFPFYFQCPPFPSKTMRQSQQKRLS